MNEKIKLVIVSIAIVSAVALITWDMAYPEPKESIEIGFADAWPVEKADNGIIIQNELVGKIPVIKFEYNNRNYTTAEEEEGLTVEPRRESFDDLLMYVENGSISQAHATALGGKVYIVYALVDNGQVYFSTEELIDTDPGNYGITLEKKDESKTVVHFNQRMSSTLILTILVTILASFVVIALLWVKKQDSKNES